MKTSRMKIVLSKLKGFENPDPELEQYETPPEVAADFINILRLHTDSEKVLDLGSGTGILSIGAASAGFKVVGVEKSKEAVKTAEENVNIAETEIGELPDIDFILADIEDIRAEDFNVNTVIMNPPFGIQEKDKNLKFLEKGFEIGKEVFALLHRSEKKTSETRTFLKEFAALHNFSASVVKTYSFRLPRNMFFHEKEVKNIQVDMYYFKEGKGDHHEN